MLYWFEGHIIVIQYFYSSLPGDSDAGWNESISLAYKWSKSYSHFEPKQVFIKLIDCSRQVNL